jgi:hypothetical protein
MKITKITVEWEDGKKVFIEEPEVTQFLTANENEVIQMYLLLAFARNLSGGYDWEEEK